MNDAIKYLKHTYITHGKYLMVLTAIMLGLNVIGGQDFSDTDITRADIYASSLVGITTSYIVSLIAIFATLKIMRKQVSKSFGSVPWMGFISPILKTGTFAVTILLMCLVVLTTSFDVESVLTEITSRPPTMNEYLAIGVGIFAFSFLIYSASSSAFCQLVINKQIKQASKLTPQPALAAIGRVKELMIPFWSMKEVFSLRVEYVLLASYTGLKLLSSYLSSIGWQILSSFTYSIATLIIVLFFTMTHQMLIEKLITKE